MLKRRKGKPKRLAFRPTLKSVHIHKSLAPGVSEQFERLSAKARLLMADESIWRPVARTFLEDREVQQRLEHAMPGATRALIPLFSNEHVLRQTFSARALAGANLFDLVQLGSILALPMQAHTAKLERPQLKRLERLARDEVSKFFSRPLEEYILKEETSFGEMPEELKKAPEQVKPELQRDLERMRGMTMLVNGVSFEASANILKKLKPELDRINPQLYKIYELEDAIHRLNYYGYLALPQLRGVMRQTTSGKSLTEMKIVKLASKKDPSKTFYLPSMGETSLRGKTVYGKLHEMIMVGTTFPTAKLLSDIMGRLSAEERAYIDGNLRSAEWQLHAYTYGPVVFKLMKRAFSQFGELPLTTRSLAEEKQLRAETNALYKALGETVTSNNLARKLVIGYRAFLELSPKVQADLIRRLANARTQASFKKAALLLRSELAKTKSAQHAYQKRKR